MQLKLLDVAHCTFTYEIVIVLLTKLETISVSKCDLCSDSNCS